jgi:SAM-dependent methyltransferase
VTNSQSGQIRSVRSQVLRSLFEALYRNRLLYWLASTIPFAGQWRTWQRLVIPRLVGSDVLETGCGIGTLLTDMAEAGFSCSAVERSSQMVAATRDRLRHHGVEGKVVLRQGIAQELPYPDASFDSVVSTFPTDYIFDPATTREMARVLRVGGRVLIVLGAQLLPAHLLLVPLVAFQTLVYGGRGRGTPDMPERAEEVGSPPPEPARGLLLERLRAAGLSAHMEVVQGPFWIAIIYVAEKIQ